MILKNDRYEACILPDYGANGISLRYLSLQLECVRAPTALETLTASPYVYGLPFCFVMLWNQGGGRCFVCLEPQTCTVNAFRLSLPEAQTGLSHLMPGKEAVFTMRMRVDE